MIWDHLSGSTSAPKVMLPPQHCSFFFLPSFWFPIYSLSQVRVKTDLHLQHRNMWRVSCGLMYFTKNTPCYHRLWSSGPDFPPRSESYLHTSQSISFSGPVGIYIKALQFHLPYNFTQFSPFSGSELLLKNRTTGIIAAWGSLHFWEVPIGWRPTK